MGAGRETHWSCRKRRPGGRGSGANKSTWQRTCGTARVGTNSQTHGTCPISLGLVACTRTYTHACPVEMREGEGSKGALPTCPPSLRSERHPSVKPYTRSKVLTWTSKK